MLSRRGRSHSHPGRRANVGRGCPVLSVAPRLGSVMRPCCNQRVARFPCERRQASVMSWSSDVVYARIAHPQEDMKSLMLSEGDGVLANVTDLLQ